MNFIQNFKTNSKRLIRLKSDEKTLFPFQMKIIPFYGKLISLSWILSFLFLSLPSIGQDILKIPVVVHIIPTDSIETNISTAQVESAIEALNDDFRYGNGPDTEIEFCLAEIDPYGNTTSGIINWGTCINSCYMGYDTIGISPQINELDIKTSTGWPVDKYYNIWVVHKLGGSWTGLNAYARRPGSPTILDGTAILFSAFGKGSNFPLESTTNLNRTITHEMGHAFGLLDVYEGDMNGTMCPTNGSCWSDGDKICDTPPSIRTNGGCPLTNACSPGNLNSNNYMNDTDESCKDRFTSGQAFRMYNTVLTTREELFNNGLACDPECMEVDASFYATNFVGNLPVSVNAFNTSTSTSGNISGYVWYKDGVEVGADEPLMLLIDSYGVFELCIEAFDDTCSEISCQLINVSPSPMNPDFDFCESSENIINDPSFTNFSSPPWPPGSQFTEGLNEMAEWQDHVFFTNPNDSPWYCFHQGNQGFVGVSYINEGSPSYENVFSTDLMTLSPGNEYAYVVEYTVQQRDEGVGINDVEVRFNLSSDPNVSGNTNPQIASVSSPLNFPSTAGQFATNGYYCYEDNDSYQNFEIRSIGGTFSAPPLYNGSDEWLFWLWARNTDDLENNVYFSNLLVCPIEVCNGTPQIDFEPNGCSIKFSASSTSTSDNDPDFTWNFGDGTAFDMGSEVEHEFLWGGQHTICVFMDCGGREVVECITVLIEDDTNCDVATNCTEISIDQNMTSCGENDYLVSGEITIPDGFQPCNALDQVFTSQMAQVNNSSIDIIGTTLYYSLEVSPNDPNSSEDISANLVLCDEDGNTNCYTLTSAFSPIECDNCVQSSGGPRMAECNEELSDEDKNVYSGMFTYSPPAGFEFCGSNSTIAGMEISNSGNNFNFDLTTSASGQIDESINLTFCRYDVEGNLIGTHCVEVPIQVTIVCPNRSEEGEEGRGESRQSVASESLQNDNVEIIYATQLSANSLQVRYSLLDNDATINILDNQGKILGANMIKANSSESTIMIEGLIPGLYIIQLIDEEGNLDIEKVILF